MTNTSTAQAMQDRSHAYDPATRPALFDGVLSRRAIAFLFDVVMITALVAAASVFVAILGVLTFGLGWLLYGILAPLVAISYTALTLGGSQAATPGMRLMGLEMRLWYGAKPYLLLAIMHSLLFWFIHVVFTPFMLLVALFSKRGQLLHDMILGSVIVDRDALYHDQR
ncbi:MAG: RDD family protein [Cohaesibacter sp.]|nr:RDD family protein [Cohaesibacter sp.]MCV6601368.1 RDD family protein [Cohaesibacter sp.]